MTTTSGTYLRNLAAIATFLLPTGFAAAADLVAEYNPPQSYSWTGAFAGVELAHISSSYAVTDSTGDPAIQSYIDAFNGEFDMTSIGYGARAGYNYQLDNNVVLGVQGLVLVPNLEGGYIGEASGTAIADVNVSVDWVAALQGTVGYAFDRTMVYAGAGVAFGGVTVDVDGISEAVDLSAKEQHAGWLATLGVAHALTDNVFVSLDYTHVDLGETDYDLTGSLPGGSTAVAAKGGGTGELIRAGLNFRF